MAALVLPIASFGNNQASITVTLDDVTGAVASATLTASVSGSVSISIATYAAPTTVVWAHTTSFVAGTETVDLTALNITATKNAKGFWTLPFIVSCGWTI